MVFTEHKRITNEIDEIDHLTIKRRQNKEFDSRKAAELIRRYSVLDADVNAALGLSRDELAFDALAALSQEELFSRLVVIREVLIKKSGI